MSCSYIDYAMDVADLQVIASSDLKVKIGVCRGGQLLNCAVGGGKMWQDVDGHNGRDHFVKDLVTGEEIRLNSVHHQMMRPGSSGKLVAVSKSSTFKDGYERLWKRGESPSGDDEVDPEVIYYPNSDTLCFQPHPEYNHPETRKYFYSLIDRYVLNTPPF